MLLELRIIQFSPFSSYSCPRPIVCDELLAFLFRIPEAEASNRGLHTGYCALFAVPLSSSRQRSSELDWNVYMYSYICLTQLYDGRDMYRIYYVKNKYMFRHFTLHIISTNIRWYRISNYTNLEYHVIAEPMYPHHPSHITHVRSRTHFTSYLSPMYTTHISRVQLLTKFFISQPEDGQCKVP